MSYEAWRISFQSSEQAARSAYGEITRLRAELAKVTWQRNEARADLADSQAECENASHRRDHLVNVLFGIYALLYPAPITTPNGQVMMFRPNSPDPHAVLQELSDRIRAIPATIDAAIAGEVKP